MFSKFVAIVVTGAALAACSVTESVTYPTANGQVTKTVTVGAPIVYHSHGEYGRRMTGYDYRNYYREIEVPVYNHHGRFAGHEMRRISCGDYYWDGRYQRRAMC